MTEFNKTKLNKIENGCTYCEDFKEQTLLWTLSPSDANNIRFDKEKGLRILHSEKYTMFTITEPEAEEYSCIVELDHKPYNSKDIGGIIVLANNREYAECQSFLATGSSEFNNSVIYEADLQKTVDLLLNDSYTRYTFDDNELDNELNNPLDESSTGTTEEGNEKPFEDISYRFIKFTKRKYKYLFWASKDGTNWFEVGNVSFNYSGAVGFFLYGTTDQEVIEHSHFYIKSINFYSSIYLTVDGIPRNYDFEITNAEGQILLRTDSTAYLYMISRVGSHCSINTTTLLMPIKNAQLRIYPKKDYGNYIGTYDLGDNVYGGDVFNFEYNIKVFINNQEVDSNNIFDLGEITRGNHRVIMIVKNCEDYAITNIKLRVVAYSEYYTGFEEAELALPIDDIPDGNLLYNKAVVVERLDAGSSQPVHIRLTDKIINLFYHAANIYRFKIIIECIE